MTTERTDPHGGQSPHPFFRVVAGHPTGEELAALTVVLAVVTADSERRERELASATAHRTRPYGWASRSQLLRVPLLRGPGAWSRSAWPR